MSEMVTLTAGDGHQLEAYVARPAGTPVAGLVVIQEIFGVNSHIRSVADGYARDGFLVIAPATFDRIERGVQLSYAGEDSKKANELMGKLRPDTALLDIAASLAWLRQTNGNPNAGVVGFCYGGLLSWLSATRLDPQAAVGYYPGGIGNFAEEVPKAPVMLHFGEKDTHIPLSNAEKVHTLHPEVQVYLYEDAGHAFNRDVMPESYDAESAMLARERSLAFLKEHLVGAPS
ncbi:MAG TPA: dienelactone hydrolase family protein [Acidisarcina sp.]